jgi:hypothetical protein
MNATMSLQTLPRHTIICHARREAFALLTQSILGRLGYSIWQSEDYYARREDLRESDPPVLRLVDERRLGEVEEEPGGNPAPIVLLTGRRGVTGADPRVVGAVKRPAGLHDLYRVMQDILEDQPRSCPRVPTHLRARCTRRGREWSASILSISENGCLIRSTEALPLGTDLEISFDLPMAGALELKADTAYQLVPDVGLVFNQMRPDERIALQKFVSSALL